MTWPAQSPNGPTWWRAKARTYYTRAPGWAADEARAGRKRLTDWEFLAQHGGSVPAWARPDYRSPLAVAWRRAAPPPCAALRAVA